MSFLRRSKTLCVWGPCCHSTNVKAMSCFESLSGFMVLRFLKATTWPRPRPSTSIHLPTKRAGSMCDAASCCSPTPLRRSSAAIRIQRRDVPRIAGVVSSSFARNSDAKRAHHVPFSPTLGSRGAIWLVGLKYQELKREREAWFLIRLFLLKRSIFRDELSPKVTQFI